MVKWLSEIFVCHAFRTWYSCTSSLVVIQVRIISKSTSLQSRRIKHRRENAAADMLPEAFWEAKTLTRPHIWWEQQERRLPKDATSHREHNSGIRVWIWHGIKCYIRSWNIPTWTANITLDCADTKLSFKTSTKMDYLWNCIGQA